MTPSPSPLVWLDWYGNGLAAESLASPGRSYYVQPVPGGWRLRGPKDLGDGIGSEDLGTFPVFEVATAAAAAVERFAARYVAASAP